MPKFMEADEIGLDFYHVSQMIKIVFLHLKATKTLSNRAYVLT